MRTITTLNNVKIRIMDVVDISEMIIKSKKSESVFMYCVNRLLNDGLDEAANRLFDEVAPLWC